MSQLLSGTSLVRYFDSGSYVGSREQYSCGYRTASGEVHSAYWPNTAYFCPHCGEVWGREVLTHRFNYSPIPDRPWVVESRRCPKHGEGLFLTGKLLDTCSPELLRREFLILCNLYDKESKL